jgi:hypothetical protein
MAMSYSRDWDAGVEMHYESGYYSDPFAFSESDRYSRHVGLEETEGNRLGFKAGREREKYAPTLFEK